METYSFMREMADSWGLVAMMVFFIMVVLMLFRPSAKKQHEDASMIPFRETKPDDVDNNKSNSKSEQPMEGLS